MVSPTLRPTLTVAEVTQRWPATLGVFARRGMACVGCAMAPFDTVAEAAGAYGQAVGELLTDLAEAASVLGAGTGRRRRAAPGGRHRPAKGGAP